MTSYFSDGMTRHKLCIMYVLSVMRADLTRVQLTTILAQNDWVTYFDAQAGIAELEEAGLIAAIPYSYGQGYRLTKQGDEMLSLFIERLPKSLREQCNDYIEANREKLRAQVQYTSFVEKQPNGAYAVCLRALERDRTLFSIKLDVPDSATARHACRAWTEKAEVIYQHLVQALLLDG